LGVEVDRGRSFAADMSEVHHATVFFTGRVQGVGFRYQTMQVAKEFDVSGCVQNLADGRVQLEVEGAAGEVRDFIEAVQDRMVGYIRKTEQSEGRRDRQFLGFAMR
jgi:acylphosphatase